MMQKTIVSFGAINSRVIEDIFDLQDEIVRKIIALVSEIEVSSYKV